MNSPCQKKHWKEHKTEHRKIQKAPLEVKTEGEEDDDSKSGSKNKTSSPKESEDECPICLDALPMDVEKFIRFVCCGKSIHPGCNKQLDQTKSKNIREYCPLCRTKIPTTGEEGIKQIQKWVKKKKAWALCNLGNIYFLGEYGVKLHGWAVITRDLVVVSE